MYLEGSDQHRGWFQSSLLLGLGTRGRAPYREVITNGFLIDMDGRKMSKSIGNVIAPQDVMKQTGADILRLWVAMSDYTEELRVSKEILTRASEAYRKIRNTLRYLVANLYDFNPATDRVGHAQLEEVDRYILARYADVSTKILQAYEDYDYSTIFQAINAFTAVDLSAFYADVSKDRLYTFAAASRSGARRKRPCISWRTGSPGCSRPSCRFPPTSSGAICQARVKTRCTSRCFPHRTSSSGCAIRP